MEAVGAVDEASAALGLARSLCRSPEAASLLVVQRDLFGLMAELAATPENAPRFRVIDAARVTWLEEQTDRLSTRVTIPGEFIVAGDVPGSGALDLARTIVRRAERRVVELAERGEADGISNPDLQRYLNRLSSFIFVLELCEIQEGGVDSPTLAKG